MAVIARSLQSGRKGESIQDGVILSSLCALVIWCFVFKYGIRTHSLLMIWLGKGKPTLLTFSTVCQEVLSLYLWISTIKEGLLGVSIFL
jgi:hypothetical protein